MQEDATQMPASAPAPSVTPAFSLNEDPQPVEPTDASLRCPSCGRSFNRIQERDRHLRLFLPYFLFCPMPSCPWRGDRANNLDSHWTMNHPSSGPAPNRQDCKIYNPDPLVQNVVSGDLPIEMASAEALTAVESRAQELGKVGVWADWWGRRQRDHH